MLKEALHYGRLSIALARGLHAKRPDEPERLIREQLEKRDERFLELVRQSVFERSANPYRMLFEGGGCSFGDLASEVRRNGLETTLKSLQQAGVYLTHDEFKGKKPIERFGRSIEADTTAFRNPTVSGFYSVSSSGSRSRGTISTRSRAFMYYRQCFRHLVEQEFDLARRTEIIVAPILPSMTGFGSAIGSWRRGAPAAAWFAVGGAVGENRHYRAVTQFLVWEGRLLGARMPSPEYLPPNDFRPVVERLARLKAEGRDCFIGGMVSTIVRIASAAIEANVDISGTLFSVGGEALTDSKRAVIESAGCRVFPTYGMTELGSIGRSCSQMTSGNVVHLFDDSIAAINRRRQAPLADVEVDSLMFTTLHPASPYVVINVEMDDAGTIEPCECDCAFTRFGFRTRIRDIFSYGKLTGQGMTLVGDDLLGILERRLPGRFGGNPSDYQLIEQEGGAQTEMLLRISPRLGAAAEDVKGFFLDELKGIYGGALARRSWMHTGGVRVEAKEPFVTSSGKVLPLYLLGVGKRAGAAERENVQ